jgi:hypothetical protein
VTVATAAAASGDSLEAVRCEAAIAKLSVSPVIVKAHSESSDEDSDEVVTEKSR